VLLPRADRAECQLRGDQIQLFRIGDALQQQQFVAAGLVWASGFAFGPKRA